MLEIKCTNLQCESRPFLEQAPWESFKGEMNPGEPQRVILTCPACHKEFMLTIQISEVVEEEG